MHISHALKKTFLDIYYSKTSWLYFCTKTMMLHFLHFWTLLSCVLCIMWCKLFTTSYSFKILFIPYVNIFYVVRSLLWFALQVSLLPSLNCWMLLTLTTIWFFFCALRKFWCSYVTVLTHHRRRSRKSLFHDSVTFYTDFLAFFLLFSTSFVCLRWCIDAIAQFR